MIAEYSVITWEDIHAAEEAAERADQAASRAYAALEELEKRAKAMATEADHLHAAARRLRLQVGFRRLVELVP